MYWIDCLLACELTSPEEVSWPLRRKDPCLALTGPSPGSIDVFGALNPQTNIFAKVKSNGRLITGHHPEYHAETIFSVSWAPIWGHKPTTCRLRFEILKLQPASRIGPVSKLACRISNRPHFHISSWWTCLYVGMSWPPCNSYTALTHQNIWYYDMKNCILTDMKCISGGGSVSVTDICQTSYENACSVTVACWNTHSSDNINH